MPAHVRSATTAVEEAERCGGAPPSAIHAYAYKLRRPDLLGGVRLALGALDATPRPGSLDDVFRSRFSSVPGPYSVNLDLTVACNYGCPHCIDGSIINSGGRYAFDEVRRSLVVLRLAGLRSVILIGGGEPTLHPRFADAVRAIKLLGLQCAVVSNGSNNERIRELAPVLRRGDWVRLSLDAGSDATFREMHLPRKPGLTLDGICASAGEIKRANPEVSLGFSYIVTWRGATVYGQAIADNVDEMAAAAKLARDSGFDYIAFKPLLDRDAIGAETITIQGTSRERARREDFLRRVGDQLQSARAFETTRFRVVGSVNLGGLTDAGEMAQLRHQPHRCHMRLFRQVLTPTGVFGCPANRNNEKDLVAPHGGYASAEGFFGSRRRTADLVEAFDATDECRTVACIYNSANWWLDDVRAGFGEATPHEDATDAFL
jgi:pyruvate-formate lyase-activating enzyme